MTFLIAIFSLFVSIAAQACTGPSDTTCTCKAELKNPSGGCLSESVLNIIWVSDFAEAGTNNVDDPDGPYTDEGFLTLLRNVGHTVTRYNAVVAPIPAGDVALLNAADLIIIGKAGSQNFNDASERVTWNTQVTTPIIATNSFSVRGSSLGWFVLEGAFDTQGIATPFTFTDITSAASSFLVGDTLINTATSTTINNMFEDVSSLTVHGSRGTTVVNHDNNPVAGGVIVATLVASSLPKRQIVTYPAGTTSQSGQVFGGFRMFFAAGNREAQATPIAGDAGYENLSPECEQIFLRAVQLAANNGEAEFCCEASAIGDPHLRGANGAKFEFGGMPNASYALLTTPAFALNMRMVAHGPQLHFIGHVGVVMRGKSLEIGPWSFQHGTAKLATYFGAIGARVVALDALRVTVELCLGHRIEISVRHIDSQNYLNVHVDIPGCNDAFGGVLGGTFKCDRSQPFVWSSAMEESFRIESLVSAGAPYTLDGECVAHRQHQT